jgi:hypothetical protein
MQLLGSLSTNLQVHEIRNAETSLWTLQWSRSSCDLTVQILSGFRDSLFHDFRSLVTELPKPRTPRCRNEMALGSAATCPLRWTVQILSGFHESEFRVSGYGVQSPLLVQLPIPDFAIESDRRLTIFLDPTVQNDSGFRDSRILTAVF